MHKGYQPELSYPQLSWRTVVGLSCLAVITGAAVLAINSGYWHPNWAHPTQTHQDVMTALSRYGYECPRPVQVKATARSVIYEITCGHRQAEAVKYRYDAVTGQLSRPSVPNAPVRS